MIRIKILFIGISLISFSCNLKNVKSDKNPIVDNTPRNVLNKDIKKNEFKESGLILPIFTISPNSYGILIELNFNEDNDLNSLYNNIGETLLNLALENNTKTDKLKRIDFTGYQKLYSNPQITNHLKKYLSKEFQIYCTKGITKTRTKDITFHPSDCQTNYVLIRFEQIDKKNGEPIFASQQKIELKYGKYNEVKEKYNNKENKIEKDYPDNKHIVFFAKSNDYYFGYNDDFERYKNKKEDYYSNLKVYFPYRKIIKFKKDSIKVIFNKEIDIFGVPCD